MHASTSQNRFHKIPYVNSLLGLLAMASRPGKFCTPALRSNALSGYDARAPALGGGVTRTTAGPLRPAMSATAREEAASGVSSNKLYRMLSSGSRRSVSNTTAFTASLPEARRRCLRTRCYALIRARARQAASPVAVISGGLSRRELLKLIDPWQRFAVKELGIALTVNRLKASEPTPLCLTGLATSALDCQGVAIPGLDGVELH
jgi:hypothetical protein